MTPLGNANVVMAIVRTMVTLKELLALKTGVPPSLTSTAKLKVPVVVGVPLIAPSASVKPGRKRSIGQRPSVRRSPAGGR